MVFKVIHDNFFIYNFFIQVDVAVSLVVLEEHVSYNDSQSAYNPTSNVIRKIQKKKESARKLP
jgi:hypothetical protein